MSKMKRQNIIFFSQFYIVSSWLASLTLYASGCHTICVWLCSATDLINSVATRNWRWNEVDFWLIENQELFYKTWTLISGWNLVTRIQRSGARPKVGAAPALALWNSKNCSRSCSDFVPAALAHAPTKFSKSRAAPHSCSSRVRAKKI